MSRQSWLLQKRIVEAMEVVEDNSVKMPEPKEDLSIPDATEASRQSKENAKLREEETVARQIENDITTYEILRVRILREIKSHIYSGQDSLTLYPRAEYETFSTGVFDRVEAEFSPMGYVMTVIPAGSYNNRNAFTLSWKQKKKPEAKQYFPPPKEILTKGNVKKVQQDSGLFGKLFSKNETQ